MRGADQIRRAKQRMILRQWRIFFVYIDACLDPAFTQGVCKCLLIYDRASCGVDQDRTLFHKADLFLSDQSLCLRCERGVNGYDVRLFHDIFQRHQLDPEFLCALFHAVVIAYDAATESLKDLGCSAADGSRSDDSDGAACKFISGELPFSLATLHCLVACRNIAQAGKAESKRKLCNGVITISAGV